MQSPSQRLAVPDLVERFGRRDSRRRRGRAGLHRPTRRSGLVGQHQLFDKRQEHRLQQIGINFGQHVGKRLTHRRLAGKSQQMSHPRAVQFEPMHDRTNPSKPTQRAQTTAASMANNECRRPKRPRGSRTRWRHSKQAPGGLNIHDKTFATSQTKNGGTFLPRQAPQISSYSALLFHQGKLAHRDRCV